MPKQLTPSIIKEWLALTSRTFDIREIWADLGIITPDGRKHLRVILFRFEHTEPPLVANLGSGKYRKVDSGKTPVDW